MNWDDAAADTFTYLNQGKRAFPAKKMIAIFKGKELAVGAVCCERLSAEIYLLFGRKNTKSSVRIGAAANSFRLLRGLSEWASNF